MKTKFFSFVFLTLAICAPLHAAELGFACQFTKGAVGDLKDGVLKHTETKKGDLPPLSFSLNTTTLKGTVVGNLGKSTVDVVSGKHVINFVEVTGAGNVISTSIFFPDNHQNGNLHHATHTRNIALKDGAIVSSYFGFCKMFDL